MKARITNQNEFGGFYTDEFIAGNFNQEINGLIVSQWQLTSEAPDPNLVIPKWNGTNWIEGVTPEEINKKIVPATISQMNLRVQLILENIAIASIYQAIEAIPDEIQKQIVYNKFEYATEFDRTDQSLNQLAAMLYISPETLDQIFIDGNLV